jgi:hypothetical protein
MDASQRRWRGGVNVECPQHASARTNDIEAREVRRRLGWPGQIPGDAMLSACGHRGHEPGIATARRCVVRVANAVSYRDAIA